MVRLTKHAAINLTIFDKNHSLIKTTENIGDEPFRAEPELPGSGFRLADGSFHQSNCSWSCHHDDSLWTSIIGGDQPEPAGVSRPETGAQQENSGGNPPTSWPSNGGDLYKLIMTSELEPAIVRTCCRIGLHNISSSSTAIQFINNAMINSVWLCG